MLNLNELKRFNYMWREKDDSEIYRWNTRRHTKDVTIHKWGVLEKKIMKTKS